MKIGIDKIKHFICCIIIVLIFGTLYKGLANYDNNISNTVIILNSFSFAMFIGFGKEFLDSLGITSNTNTFDWNDILADFIGSIVGSIILFTILLLM